MGEGPSPAAQPWWNCLDLTMPFHTQTEHESCPPWPLHSPPRLPQEGIFKGQRDVCQRDIRAEGRRPMPGPLPRSTLPASPRRAKRPHATAEASPAP